jgi:predicted regulator of Ras-like GTPase activity (Roadblock/LC7/MglB family)
MSAAGAPLETPFTRILRGAVEGTPGAVGGAFAAGDGEAIDVVGARWSRGEWELITAHHGIILAHARAALRTFHYGDPAVMVVGHRDLQVVLHEVADGYFALLALEARAALGAALATLEQATRWLRAEMGA